jgi:hypothetical protein
VRATLNLEADGADLEGGLLLDQLKFDFTRVWRALRTDGMPRAGDRSGRLVIELDLHVDSWPRDTLPGALYEALRELFGHRRSVVEKGDPGARFHLRIVRLPLEGDERRIVQTLDQILDALRRRNEEIDAAHQPIIEATQDDLRRLEGHSEGSLEANQTLTDLIMAVSDGLRRAFACQRVDDDGTVCGHPAQLRCRPAKGQQYAAGKFQFEHSIDGRQTNHGGYNAIPPLILVPLPPDRRKRAARQEKT